MQFDKARSVSIKAPDWNRPGWYRVEGETCSKISEKYWIQKEIKPNCSRTLCNSSSGNLFDIFAILFPHVLLEVKAFSKLPENCNNVQLSVIRPSFPLNFRFI